MRGDWSATILGGGGGGREGEGELGKGGREARREGSREGVLTCGVEAGECSGTDSSKEEPECLEVCLTEWERGGMKGGGLELGRAWLAVEQKSQ